MDTIKETINKTGFFRRWFVKRYIEKVKAQLIIGEELLGMGAESDLTNEILFITNKRIIKYGLKESSFTITTVPIEEISAYHFKQGFIWTEIEIKSPHNEISVKRVPNEISNELQKILTNLAI